MSISLQECIDLREGGQGLRVDRERGVIHGVKILGWRSANGREYTPAGVDPKLYESRVVNANHVKRGEERSVYDRFGRTVNVVKRADGLYGDLEVLKSHELAPRVFEAAERMPGVFGLSHTARGREKAGSRGAVIEAVESVQSVDLVGDPATVAGLHESRSFRVRKKLSELIEHLNPKRPGYARALSEMAEAGIMPPDAPMDEPPPLDEPADEGGDHEQAVLDAAKAVLDDSGLKSPEKLAKIKQLLAVIDGKGGGGKGPPKKDKGESEGKTEESLKSEVALLRAANKVGVKLGKALLESVRPGLSDAEAEALVAEHGGRGGHQRPRSATPGAPARKADGTVQESKKGDAKIPEDPAVLGRWLSGGR